MRWAAESTAIPVGRLKIAFAEFQASDHAAEFAAGLKNENLARLRIGDINVVLRVDGDALRREQMIFSFIPRRMNLYFCCGEIEDVHAIGAGIGDDDAPARIRDDAVRPHQRMKFRLARHHVDHFVPESALGFDVALRPEIALAAELAATLERSDREPARPRAFSFP